jgi:adenylate kinase
MGRVFLLTGPPATGKSTLRQNLVARMPGLTAFDYGQLLLKQKSSLGVELSYEELREQSSHVVTPSNVTSLDEEVISEVSRLRLSSDVILDSHAVTREPYGFRAIPFSLSQLTRLSFDAVIVLRCDVDVLLARMEKDRGGRRSVTPELAREHQLLQEGVGVSYAIACGCPVFILDTTALTKDEVAKAAQNLLDSTIATRAMS